MHAASERAICSTVAAVILIGREFFAAVLKEGWLTKQGGRYKSWKKRYFALRESRLVYYKDNKKKVYTPPRRSHAAVSAAILLQ